MSMNGGRAAQATKPRFVWLVAAAAVGAVSALAVLRLSSGAPSETPAPEVRATGGVAHSPLGSSTRGSHLPAPASSDRTAAGTVSRNDALATDDASLLRRARDEFGYDCDSIASRSAARSGTFEITCANGLALRVHALEGAPTRFAPVH
jgi:hypothetical protein